MDDAHNGQYAREPQVEDLARICQALNEAGARYYRLYLEELLHATRRER